MSVYGNKSNYMGTSSASSASQSSVNIDKVKQDYERFEDPNKKKEVLMSAITSKTKEREVEAIFQLVYYEKDDFPYRCEVLDYFMTICDNKIPEVILKFFNLQYMTILLKNETSFERFGVICKTMLNNRYYDSSYKKDIKKLIYQKISTFTQWPEISKFFKLEEIDRFLEFKKFNVHKEYKLKSERDIDVLKFQIRMIFYGIVEPLSIDFPSDTLTNILLRWILVLAPLADAEEYKLLHEISNVVNGPQGNSKQISLSKVRSIVTTILEFFKIKFSPGDQFQGYRNLVIVLEMMSRGALQQCIENYFLEINDILSEKQVLFQVLYNMVNANITENSCVFIYNLAQNYQINRLFDKLIYIFQIIWQNLLPKIRVKRCFEVNLQVCEFFFFGLVKVQKLNENIFQILLLNLKFLALEAYKGQSSAKNQLAKYLDFLNIIASIYENRGNERESFTKLNQIISEMRREFNLSLSENELQKLVSGALEYVWEIQDDDLNPNNRLSMSDTLLMKYDVDERYKGIRNVGNTCYMASTMQALFRCEYFKNSILEVMNQSMKNAKVGSSDGWPAKSMSILAGTQKLFSALADKNDKEAFDPTLFKESLPQQFANSKREQDAYEFLVSYLDSMENYLKTYDTEKELISRNFNGEQVSLYICRECKSSYKQKETIFNLYLSFKENSKRDDQIHMIKRIFEPEEFENQIDCEKCKAKSKLMTKEVELTKLPPNLIITLNRFAFDKDKKEKTKIFDPVTIYDHLDLNNILGEKIKVDNAKYLLCAIVVHVGVTTETGHYYTVIRDTVDDKLWIVMNDSLAHSLGKIDLSEVFKPFENDCPYILFYQKVA